MLSVATSLSLALTFTFATSVKANALSGPCAEIRSRDERYLASLGLGTATLRPGEETFLCTSPVPGKYAVYTFDITSGSGRFLAKASNDATAFKMFIEEGGKLVDEGNFTGSGVLEFEPRIYQAARFGVENTAQESDTFCAQIESCLSVINPGFPFQLINSAATRILAPIAALLGGLLFLF